MEPTTTVTIIISVVGLVSGVLAHMRFRSKCHLGDTLEISIQKEADKENNKNLSSLSDSSEATSI